MNDEIVNYLDSFDERVVERFYELYELIKQSTEYDVAEKLWAKLPTFSVGDNYIRLIPFKDHYNINLSSNFFKSTEFEGYKSTPKGMVQIYHNQVIPEEKLLNAFRNIMGRS